MMKWLHGLHQPGVLAALVAALLFGGGTQLAKWLLTSVNPWLLASLVYLGSGLGLSAYRAIRQVPLAKLAASEWLFRGVGQK